MVKGKEYDEAMWRVKSSELSSITSQSQLEEADVQLLPLLDTTKGGRLLEYILKAHWQGKEDELLRTLETAGVEDMPITQPSLPGPLFGHLNGTNHLVPLSGRVGFMANRIGIHLGRLQGKESASLSLFDLRVFEPYLKICLCAL